MSKQKPTGTLATYYESRIGEATTNDEVTGYWLFFVGVIVGLLGMLGFFATEPATTTRGLGYALLALSPVLIILGAVIRFPLRRTAAIVASLGALVCIAAIVWFLSIFPGGWSLTVGDTGVILTYIVGLVVLGVAGAFIPLLTDPMRSDYADMERRSQESAAALDEERERTAELQSRLDAAEAELASMKESKARFELFEDSAGKWRWRLRHTNGNIIADSAQGYSSKQKCQQGKTSVRRNAFGAGTLQIDPEAGEEPDDAGDPAVAVPAEPPASDATFELFEDDAGEYRFRLRHTNGNIIADSSEGYSNKSNAKRAMKRLREHVAAADYLRIDPAAYEIYRDKAGEYRWRLLHKNGNVLADSGEGYSSRSAARKGVESVRETIADAEVEEQ